MAEGLYHLWYGWNILIGGMQTWRDSVCSWLPGFAPEHPFPAAVNSSYTTAKWIARHGINLGGDTDRIALMGNSAGTRLVEAVITHKTKRLYQQKLSCRYWMGFRLIWVPSGWKSSRSCRRMKWAISRPSTQLVRGGKYAPTTIQLAGSVTNINEGPGWTSTCCDYQCRIWSTKRRWGIVCFSLRSAGVKVWGVHCACRRIHCLIGLMPGTDVNYRMVWRLDWRKLFVLPETM